MAAGGQRRDVAIVDQAQVDDVDRDFRVVARAQLVPDFLFQLLLRDRRAGAGGLGRRLQAERIGVLAFDAEHVAVHDHRVAAAERLRDVGLLALLQRDPVADGDDGRLNIAS